MQKPALFVALVMNGDELRAKAGMVAMKHHVWYYGVAGHGLAGSYFFHFIIA